MIVQKVPTYPTPCFPLLTSYVTMVHFSQINEPILMMLVMVKNEWQGSSTWVERYHCDPFWKILSVSVRYKKSIL